MATDYYLTLGITPAASADQVRRAFRTLCLRHHPDRAGQAGEQRFLEIQEAYETLGNATRRAEYHRLGDAPRRRPSATPLWPEPIDLFGSFAGYHPSREAVLDAFMRGLIGRGVPKSRRLGVVNLELVLSSAEAARGGHLPIDLPLARLCVRCDGTGRTGYFHCDACDGHGMIWGQARVELLVPPGTGDGTMIPVSLRHLGADAMALNVHLHVA
jgi:molecular chaperone DnaJ